MAGIGQDLKKIYSDETRIVENASLCTIYMYNLHAIHYAIMYELDATSNEFKRVTMLVISKGTKDTDQYLKLKSGSFSKGDRLIKFRFSEKITKI